MLNTDLAALAHLGERQTEVHFESRIQCDFWRYCVRSTEAASLLPFYSTSCLHLLLLRVFCVMSTKMISSPLLLPSELLVRERRDNRVWSLANPPAPSNSNFLLASHDADGAIAQFPRRLVHSSVSDNMFLTIGSICMS